MSCSTPCRSTASSIEKGELRELYVGVEKDRLCEVVGPPSTPAITARIGELAHGLPDGYRGEVNLGIDTRWAGLASETLGAGYVMTVDYGYDPRSTLCAGPLAGHASVLLPAHPRR